MAAVDNGIVMMNNVSSHSSFLQMPSQARVDTNINDSLRNPTPTHMVYNGV